MQISGKKKKNLVSGNIFPFQGKILDSSNAFFFQISMPFLISEIDPARPTLTIAENRTDQFFQWSVLGYSALPFDAGGLSPSWVEN